MKADYVYDLPMSFNDDFQIGIVISLNPKHKQFHCGLAFDLDNQQQVIHLATHNNLEYDDNISLFQCIIKPNLPSLVQESFISLCEVIRDEIKKGNNHIPYGFLYDDYAIVDNDGNLKLSQNEIGLTCATYVLTIFHTFGFDLVDIQNWPPREEDMPWFSNILTFFIKHNIAPIEHILKLFPQMNCPRFRPEEVAVSSALYSGTPAPTYMIWEHGEQLSQYMYSIV